MTQIPRCLFFLRIASVVGLFVCQGNGEAALAVESRYAHPKGQIGKYLSCLNDNFDPPNIRHPVTKRPQNWWQRDIQVIKHPQGFFRVETSCLLTWKQLQECDWQGFPKFVLYRIMWSHPSPVEVGEASMVWISLKRRASQARTRKKKCDAIRWIRHLTTGWAVSFWSNPIRVFCGYFGGHWNTVLANCMRIGSLRNPFVKFQNHQNLNQSLWN